MALLTIEDLNSEIEKINKKKSDDIIFVLRQLLENEEILIKSNNKYTLKYNGKIKNRIYGTPEFAVGILDCIIKTTILLLADINLRTRGQNKILSSKRICISPQLKTITAYQP
jgi:hypothetical protein